MASLESLAMSILPVSTRPSDPPGPDTELSHIPTSSLLPTLYRGASAGKVTDDNNIPDHPGQPEHVGNDLPPPSTAVHALQRWNHPRSNKGRFLATLFAFLIFGFNDSAYGVGCYGFSRKSVTGLTSIRH